jgi:3-oxoacyl-[acyl-carrier-protein] synthase-3
MNGKDMLGFVLNNVPDNVNSALAQAHLSVDDVDFFVFHQASGIILDMLSDRLGIDAERVPRELSDVGNTVSASIPIVLNGLKESGRLSDGDVVVLSGFGAGLSWGTAVLVW